MVRIIFVAGIFTPKFSLNIWKQELEKKFPESEIITIGKWYNYFKIHELENVTNELTNIIEDNKGTILIGHSFGGIVINSAIAKSKKSQIKQIITIASPHKINYFGMKKRKEILGYKIPKKIKMKSFGAYFDPVVPFFLSKLNNHKNLFVDHFIFIGYFRCTIRKILKLSFEK